jgi:hypothetical protein
MDSSGSSVAVNEQDPRTGYSPAIDQDPRILPVAANHCGTLKGHPMKPLPRRQRPFGRDCYYESRDKVPEGNLQQLCGSRKLVVSLADRRNGIGCTHPGDKIYGRVEDSGLHYSEIEPVEFRRYVDGLPPVQSALPGGYSPVKRRARNLRDNLRKSREALRDSVRSLDDWGPGQDREEAPQVAFRVGTANGAPVAQAA